MPPGGIFVTTLYFLLLHFTFSAAMAWYVVHRRKEPGVYSSWDKAHAQVDGFQG